jgi:acyl-CoA hydrolase
MVCREVWRLVKKSCRSPVHLEEVLGANTSVLIPQEPLRGALFGGWAIAFLKNRAGICASKDAQPKVFRTGYIVLMEYFASANFQLMTLVGSSLH